MNGLLLSLFGFVVALGILITVHEFGHYWVARRLGVKVLRFSVGFGRPLWRRRLGRDQTEFVVAAIPLGGYVQMLDEREAAVDPAERHRAFNAQSVGRRMAIVLAGPLANFLLAAVAYWLIFVIGSSALKAVVGEVAAGSPAEQAGLRSGDWIVEVDGRSTPTWPTAMEALLPRVINAGVAQLTVERDGYPAQLQLDLAALPERDTRNLLGDLGIAPQQPRLPPVIDQVAGGSASAEAGLRPGDRVVAIDGEPVDDWRQLVERVAASPEQRLQVAIERTGERLELWLTPVAVETTDGVIGRIGASVYYPQEAVQMWFATVRLGPLQALGEAAAKTGEMALLTLRVLGLMVAGQMSLENLSGPITIAEYAGHSVSMGVVQFFAFLAIISISLGVINLLPIPLLDGGHLLYYVVEWVRGKPVSEAAQMVGQKIGLALILALMGLAIYNDLNRLLG